jgi:hypothetical protein
MRFLAGGELAGIELDELLAARELVVAFGEGELRGLAAAALLFADYAVLRRGATIAIDTPEGWAGAVWRAGRRALLDRPEELVDEITDDDPETWRANWLRGRSVLALDSAAVLIRSRGGDVLERAGFARLFAAGEPQKGLGAFLAKKSPRYS